MFKQFGPQVVLLFPKAVELLGGGASLEEVDYLGLVLRSKAQPHFLSMDSGPTKI